jgi:hypothetical protein
LSTISLSTTGALSSSILEPQPHRRLVGTLTPTVSLSSLSLSPPFDLDLTAMIRSAVKRYPLF